MNLTDIAPRDLQDFSKLPPAGVWLPSTVSSGEAKTSSKGNTMITLQMMLKGEGFEGYTLFENGIVTDKSSKGAGFAVKKLIGLGVDTSKEQDDQEIVNALLGKDIFVKVKHEVMKDEDPPGSGKYVKARLDDDGKPMKRAVPQEYSLYDPGTQKTEVKKAETPAPADPVAATKPVPPWIKKDGAAAESPKK